MPGRAEERMARFRLQTSIEDDLEQVRRTAAAIGVALSPEIDRQLTEELERLKVKETLWFAGLPIAGLVVGALLKVIAFAFTNPGEGHILLHIPIHGLPIIGVGIGIGMGKRMAERERKGALEALVPIVKGAVLAAQAEALPTAASEAAPDGAPDLAQAPPAVPASSS